MDEFLFIFPAEIYLGLRLMGVQVILTAVSHRLNYECISYRNGTTGFLVVL
jgi:hypothetical protein